MELWWRFGGWRLLMVVVENDALVFGGGEGEGLRVIRGL